MAFKILLLVGCTLAALMVAVAAVDDTTAPIAEPSHYSTAYLHPSGPGAAVVVPPHSPYVGAVASTHANVVRVSGNHGPVVRAASHKTVDTPFSSAHKSDVRYINDGGVPPAPYYPPYAAAAGPSYPYAPAAGLHAGPYPYAAAAAGPYPYPPAPYAGPYPYATAGPAYPYATAVQPFNKPYGYGPATASYGYGAPVVTPVHAYPAAPIVGPPTHSVSHASYSGPYGAHYSYKRR